MQKVKWRLYAYIRYEQNNHEPAQIFNYFMFNLQMSKVMEDMLDDYNQINTAQMNLVLFMDAMKHVTRISRVIRQPLGNALLLGMGGSGRQSLTRLAAHM